MKDKEVVTDIESVKLRAEAQDSGHLKLATWGTKEQLVNVLKKEQSDPFNDIKIFKLWKDNTISNLKETIKFAILAMLIYLLIGSPIIYVSIEIFKAPIEKTGIIVGIICVVITIIIDYKKSHHLLKIYENHKKFMAMIERS